MPPEVHRLLARQLRRTGCSWDAPPVDISRWHDLLQRIGRTYAAAEDDRYTLERAMEISSRELRDARDAAEMASRAKSSFLANMSHEIRTPMNGVIGITELLIRSDLDNDQIELVETLRRSSEALLLILNDVLDFSKIEAGHLTLEHRAFRLTDVVGDVCDLLAEGAYRKNVELTCFVDLDVQPTLIGDADRLRQILLNLIGNAIKFTAQGNIDVRARMLHKSETTETVWFEVVDTGIGIPEDIAPKLFDPFTQADESTTRQFGGTGLGLSICRKLVELMGGAIGVDSAPGKGSRFWFYVPFQLTGDAQQPATDVDELRGMRVLFVDDSETNRKIMRWQTQALGVDLQLASDAEAGLRCLESAAADGPPFDLVILDYLMPVCDGVRLAERIRAQDLAGDAAIVLLSSAYDMASVPNLRSLGCLDVLKKPLKQRELTELLLRVQGVAAERANVEVTARERPKLRMSVLLAEDNPVNQRVATRMLECLGCSVIVAPDGAVAVEEFIRGDFDVVLMDCQMPKMGGVEATHEIRRIESSSGRPATPIIALTATAMDSDRERCLAAGMDDFLTKPVRTSALEHALRKHGSTVSEQLD